MLRQRSLLLWRRESPSYHFFKVDAADAYSFVSYSLLNIAHTPNVCLPLKILQKHCSPFSLRRLEKGKIRN